MIQDDRILSVIDKIVELKKDLTILNQSFVEPCSYWKLVMNCYHKTRLHELQYSLQHMFVVYVLSDTDT